MYVCYFYVGLNVLGDFFCFFLFVGLFNVEVLVEGFKEILGDMEVRDGSSLNFWIIMWKFIC